MSFNKLIEKIVKTQNPTVVGLDPALDLIPEFIKISAYEKHGETLKGAAKAVLKFNKGLIDALYETVPAVKPQLAFYEALGFEGIKTFYKTAEYAQKRGLFVIADAKRGDIGSTAMAYASAYLGRVKIGKNSYFPFPVNAITVNPYLGTDGVIPFVDEARENDKGIFVLAKTSNPSSGELQDRTIDGKEVYRVVGEMVSEWGKLIPGKYGYNGVGMVVGATYPEEIEILRASFPEVFFLIPGYGAQGGKSEDLVKAFDKNGLGAIVNSSRGIIAAYKKEKCDERDYAGAALREAERMQDDIMNHIGEIRI